MSKKTTKIESIYSWTAGIVDGEGSVTLTHNHSGEYRSPVLSVANTCLEILLPLQRYFGGIICNHGRQKRNYMIAYSWKITRADAIDVMHKLLPYIRHPKKSRRMKFIIRYYAKLTVRNGKYTKEQIRRKKQFEKEFFQLS